MSFLCFSPLSRSLLLSGPFLHRGLLTAFPMCGNYFGLFSLLQLDGLLPGPAYFVCYTNRHTSTKSCSAVLAPSLHLCGSFPASGADWISRAASPTTPCPGVSRLHHRVQRLLLSSSMPFLSFVPLC